jgi:CheY-like chemotaxis protein
MMSSTPGKGTEFTIFLPVVEKDEDPKINETRSQAASEDMDILFVDDEEPLRDAGVRMLENLGYRVTAVSSGIEALDLVAGEPGKIDLVITDMTMPGMTGIELAQRLLGIQPDIPIILCTGYHDTLSREKVKELGVREYLTKPYSLREIAGIISSILD